MDPLALFGGVVIAVGLGYMAAAHKYTLKIRSLQQQAVGGMVESTSRFCQAAMDTLTEDYGHDRAEALTKLLKRCADNGMAIMKIDPKTGASEKA